MSLALQHYKTTKHLLFFAFGMLLCVYFMYHSFHGNRSLLKLMQLEHAAVLLQKDLSALQQERRVLEGRVVMMRPDTIDRDLLEERARVVLGYKSQGELIILEN